jgi:hypothetical protein
MKNTLLTLAVMTLVGTEAFASTLLFKGTIDANDSRQAKCLAQLSNVPYGSAVITQGKIQVQFVEDASGKISGEVLADSAQLPGRGFINVTHLYVRAKNSPFVQTNWEGIVRD